MSTIYALFVGINQYHPQSKVPHLAGCVNDVLAFQEFIEDQYPNVVSKVLLNEQATRDNFIGAFTTHLIEQATEGDTVLLYYAGHGSFSEAASPFKKYDPKGQDESFVCYDSRLPGHYDLTDKEIAVLLSRIVTGVHTVLIADSCHSASVSRDLVANFNLARKRFTGARKGERSLKSYLLKGDEFYQDQWEATGELSIPNSKHILLSACGRAEEAWETVDRKGLFSATLLDVLKSNRNISYSDLFERVRHIVYNTAKNQKPTISPQEGFNPNNAFLENNVLPNRNRHLVKFEEGKWMLDYGGIHGLPTDDLGVEQLTIGIYEDLAEGEAALFQACVKKVLLATSILDLKEAALDTTKTYWGEIETSPTTLVVNLLGQEKEIAAFEKKYQQTSSSFLQFIKGKSVAKYTLIAYATKLKIIHAATGKLIYGKKGTGATSIKNIIKQLEKINQWEKIVQLQNGQANEAIKKAIEVQFFEESEDAATLMKREGDPIIIDYPKVGQDMVDGEPKSIYYQIKAKNVGNKKLYVALLHLGPSFDITSLFSSQVIPKQSEEFTLDRDHYLFITTPKKHQTTDIFKVIVSTIPFDDFKFQQEGITTLPSRALGKRRRATTKDDWYTQTLIVQTVRKQNELGNQTIRLANNSISIKAHPSFKADLAFQPLQTPTSRNVGAGGGMGAVFQGKDIELLNLSQTNTRSTHHQDQSLIELSAITNKEALKEHPLEITIHQSIDRHEYIVPVTMQNGYLLPFGESTKNEQGETVIQIKELPNSDASPTATGKRSLGKALWFGLLKMSGFRAKAFRLRKVEMLKNLEFLLTEKHYDLILTFDYENLNEPIEKIAKTLNKRLKKYGLGENDGKQFDILAHSMGGLVSRYMIEQIRKGDGVLFLEIYPVIEMY